MAVRSGVAEFDETKLAEAFGIACISLQVAFQNTRYMFIHSQ